MITILNTRDELMSLIEPYSKVLEIGVFKGEFAEVLLTTEPKELYLVDIWQGEWGSGDKNGNNYISISDMEVEYLKIYNKYITVPNIHVIRSKSNTFFQSIEDNYFDVVYIDGDHEQQAVYNDMINAFRVVKNGGWMMGHDYHSQIKTSVDIFCNNYEQKISYIANDGCPSFAIQLIK